jgi:hypothetical protein
VIDGGKVTLSYFTAPAPSSDDNPVAYIEWVKASLQHKREELKAAGHEGDFGSLMAVIG